MDKFASIGLTLSASSSELTPFTVFTSARSSLLNLFVSKFPCYPAPPSPNKLVRFPIVDITKAPLVESPSPFILPAWGILHRHYSWPLYLWLVLVLQFGCLVGYIGPPAHVHLEDLISALLVLDAQIMTQKLKDELFTR